MSRDIDIEKSKSILKVWADEPTPIGRAILVILHELSTLTESDKQTTLRAMSAEAENKRLRQIMKGPPSCSRPGLCREVWDGLSEYDDCYACSYRQRIEKALANPPATGRE